MKEGFKTLKDLKIGVVSPETDGKLKLSKTKIHKLIENYNKLLRQEAIKRIKIWTKEHHAKNDGYETTLERNFNPTNIYFIACSITDDGCVCDICRLLREWKNFFNTKEEDLK